MPAELNAKVACVFKWHGSTLVALNAGSNAGVAAGMVFFVSPQRIEITDPDTGTELGHVMYSDTQVVVEEVHPRMCLCRVERTPRDALIEIGNDVTLGWR